MNDINQRIAELSNEKRALLRKIAASQRPRSNRIQAKDRPLNIPLTFGQQRLWLLDQLTPGLTAYNSPLAFWLHGRPDIGALRTAIQGLCDRHEALRTAFNAPQGEPFQRILASASVPWCELEAVGQTLAERRVHALELAKAQSAMPFNLANGPFMRTCLIKVTPELYLMHWVFHHIAIDGWSMAALVSEFETHYNALVAGAPANIAVPSLQIADVAIWQQETFGNDGLRNQLNYWRTRLEGASTVLDLPSDRARPAQQSFRGAHWKTEVPAALYIRAQQFAREQNATLSMIFLAALQAVLARYSGQNDIVVSMGVAGRARLELEPVVGFFVNTLPIRSDLSGAIGFAALITRVREGVLGAMENGDAPLNRILEELRVPRAASHMPFAQVMYFFQSHPTHTLKLSQLLAEDVHGCELSLDTAQTELSLFVNQNCERELLFEYNTALFDQASIERLGGHLLNLLAAALDAPEQPISQLPMLSAAELRTLDAWNATERALPNEQNLASFIQAQVQRSPDAIAVSFADQRLSYRDLDLRAAELAQRLRAQGVAPGQLVGLYVERTPEMVIGLLGILQAGAGYVPLDPSYPADRLSYMLEASQAEVLVTQSALVESLASSAHRVVIVDANANITTEQHENPNIESAPLGAAPDDPAYVIFTSGSTGKPKGVEISQRSALNLLRSVAVRPGMNAQDRICAISTLSFDIALFELILPLTVGAEILLLDRDTARDGLRLRRVLEASAVTVMQATPATWRMLLEVGWAGKAGLKMITTGEAIPRELATRLLPCGEQLWNLYGPTETTVYSTLCQIGATETGPILVGKPVDNTQIYIVDAQMQRQAVGVPGELLIGGMGLAIGYRGRPDLTAEKFIPNPFSQDPAARLYRTGDLALWRQDGNIEVIGRIDHQIKLRGFRIELGEIETVLAQHEGVAQAVVHCREDRPGDKRLVAYVTVATQAPSISALREHLKAQLPDYMVPSAFVILTEFPLTPNGKVDRRALPEPEMTQGEMSSGVAASTPDEAELSAMWCKLLNLKSVDVGANFFELGGHSLLATQLMARIEHSFGIELPLRALFDAPTVAQLAGKIGDVRASFEAQDLALEALMQDLEHLSDEEVRAQLEQNQLTSRFNQDVA